MNIIVAVDLANGRTIQPVRAVYYSATDHTVLWERVGTEDRVLLDHPGSPEQYRLTGRNVFGAPADQPDAKSAVIAYREGPCGCGHVYKRWTPPDPLADGAAHREHAR